LIQTAAVQPAMAPTTKDSAAAAAAPAPQVPVWVFPRERLEKDYAYTTPTMPIPAGLTFDENVMGKGDAERGRQLYSRSSCIGCHAIAGNPMSMGNIGPNLTHVGTRYTIAGGLYPNDTKHLSYWLKNAPHLKPGSIMPTIGKGLVDPVRKNTITMGGLTDAEIADIVAYLQALK
jgi:cytochrome c oxidase subunit 2